MNTAPAELLHFLTNAALQPSWFCRRCAGPAAKPKNLRTRSVARACPQLRSTVSRLRRVSIYKKKPPGLNAIRRDGHLKKRAQACACCAGVVPIFAAFKNTPFQVRKVHENLVGAQPAREGITRFFAGASRMTLCAQCFRAALGA